MKLYTWDRAPNPRRVLIFMAEKGIEMPVIEAGGEAGAVLSDEFLANHEHRVVPLLELDDGTCLGESMAICRYLEELHPEPPLFGHDAEERAQVDMWERRADFEGLHAAAEVFRNTHPLFKDRSLPGFGAALAQVPALAERGRLRMQQFYEKLDRQLAQNTYVAGANYSVADITSLCAIDFAIKVSKLPIPENCLNVRRWHEMIRERPSSSVL